MGLGWAGKCLTTGLEKQGRGAQAGSPQEGANCSPCESPECAESPWGGPDRHLFPGPSAGWAPWETNGCHRGVCAALCFRSLLWLGIGWRGQDWKQSLSQLSPQTGMWPHKQGQWKRTGPPAGCGLWGGGGEGESLMARNVPPCSQMTDVRVGRGLCGSRAQGHGILGRLQEGLARLKHAECKGPQPSLGHRGASHASWENSPDLVSERADSYRG